MFAVRDSVFTGVYRRNTNYESVGGSDLKCKKFFSDLRRNDEMTAIDEGMSLHEESHG